MALLSQLFQSLLRVIIPIALKEFMEYLQDSKELNEWRKAERAKLEAAAAKYKEDLGKAGNDAQAQKDAFDKLLNSSR